MIVSIISQHKPQGNPRRVGIDSFSGKVGELHKRATAETELSIFRLMELVAAISQDI